MPQQAARVRGGYHGFGALSGFSGPTTERTALGVASFFWAVKFIASIKASVPIEIQERIGNTDNWQTLYTHPLSWLLNNQPNPTRTAISAHDERMMHLLVHGRTTSYLRLDSLGEPQAWYPVHPLNWEVPEDTAQGRIYSVSLQTGVERLDTSQVLDVIATTMDGGLSVLSPLRLFSSQLGLANALVNHSRSFWENNPRPGLIINAPGQLTDAEFAIAQSRFNAGLSGDKAGSALILDNGFTASPWQMTFADYQLLEMLGSVNAEIGNKIFNMPPESLEDDAWGRYFVDFTLRPWIERDDQELTCKLLPYSSRGRYRCRSNVGDLNRGDLRSRAEIAQRGMLTALVTQNEGRRLLDLAPVNGGDEFRVAQSVFGGQGGKVTGGDQPSKAAGSRDSLPLDAASSLIGDALGGIFSRTRHELEKRVKASDWEARVAIHFNDQRELAAKRLRMLSANARDQVVSELNRQLDQVNQLNTLDSEQRSLRLQTLADEWSARTPEIVRTLLQESR
jgi:HK97 family phage portal protein